MEAKYRIKNSHTQTTYIIKKWRKVLKEKYRMNPWTSHPAKRRAKRYIMAARAWGFVKKCGGWDLNPTCSGDISCDSPFFILMRTQHLSEGLT